MDYGNSVQKFYGHFNNTLSVLMKTMMICDDLMCT